MAGIKTIKVFLLVYGIALQTFVDNVNPGFVEPIGWREKKCQLSSELSPAWRGISLIHQGLLLV